MVREVTPFVHVTVPNWLNRKLVAERAETKGITLKKASAELFEEDDK